jgi:hypothetical protein
LSAKGADSSAGADLGAGACADWGADSGACADWGADSGACADWGAGADSGACADWGARYWAATAGTGWGATGTGGALYRSAGMSRARKRRAPCSFIQSA